jgi:hypothetical protein
MKPFETSKKKPRQEKKNAEPILSEDQSIQHNQ